MPNWTDDEGRNHFEKLDCKRCLQTFDVNEVGEIPIHKCHGGYYKSGWNGLCHHAPIKVSDEEVKKSKKKVQETS